MSLVRVANLIALGLAAFWSGSVATHIVNLTPPSNGEVIVGEFMGTSTSQSPRVCAASGVAPILVQRPQLGTPGPYLQWYRGDNIGMSLGKFGDCFCRVYQMWFSILTLKTIGGFFHSIWVGLGGHWCYGLSFQGNGIPIFEKSPKT